MKLTFIIVHGSFGGGWSWRDVARRLEAEGHIVYRPTLTGLGERAHLGGPHVGLGTHIEDVAAVITFEELRDVVLVGHSYGGLVVTGVASRLRERISQLIYIDAMVPLAGESALDMLDPDFAAQVREAAEVWGDGWMVSPPGDDLDERARPQPLKTLTQPLEPGAPAGGAAEGFAGAPAGVPVDAALPCAYICCTARAPHPMYAGIELGAARARAADWPYFEIAAGHSSQLERPDETAATILQAARTLASR